jgi:Fe-S cluster assembly iron-binding protein IscA
MRGITKRAGAKLKALLDGSDSPAPKRVRISVLEGRISLEIETQPPQLSDRVFKYDGQDVLVVGFATASHFAASTLDYQDGEFRII